MVEKIGLDAIFEDKQFQAGIKAYTESINKATQATESGATGMNASLGGATTGAAGLSLAAGALAGILAGVVTAGIAAVIGILKSLIQGLKDAATAMLSFGQDAIITAARLQELDLVAKFLGANAGVSAAEIDTLTQSIIDQGIRSDVASGLIGILVRRNLDLAAATDLAAIAQGAAVIAGIDSSVALEQLTMAIAKQRPVLLNQLGIFIDVNDANAAYAAELGVTTASLNETQKTQAFLNAVLADGASLMGLYETAMQNAGKRMRSLPRLLFEIKAAVGMPFQDAFGNVVTIMETVINAFGAAVAEGGALYPILQKLGAFAAVVTEGMAGLAAKAIPAFIDFAVQAAEVLGNVARDALDWGIEISVQLATGIIQGASTAIVAAMNFITALLQSWLSPGSPPKVAPDIDKWGAGTMDVWLEGFKDANFKILEDLKDPLEDALGGLIGGDSVSAEVLEKLLDLNLSLAEATKKVEIAESRLEAARIARGQAQVKINGLIAEHNQLLRDGADQEVLDAKLEEINAAEELRDQAAAEEAALENRVRLGRLLVDILGQQEEAKKGKGGGGGAPKLDTDALGGGGGGGIGGLLDDIEVPEFDTESLETALDETFAQIKEDIKAELTDIFEPVTTAWEEDWSPAIEDMKLSWAEFSLSVEEFWDTYIQPVVDKLKEMIPEETLTTIGFLIGQFAIFAGIATIVLTVLTVLAVIIGVLLVGAILWLAFKIGEFIGTTIQKFIEWKMKVAVIFASLVAKIKGIFGGLKTIIAIKIEEIKAKFEQMKTDLAAKIETIKRVLKQKFETALESARLKVIEVRNALMEKLRTALTTVKNHIVFLKNTIKRKLEVALATLKTKLIEVRDYLKEKLALAIETAKTKFQEIRDKIVTTVTPAINTFKTNVLEPLKTAFDKVKSAVGFLITAIMDLLIALGLLEDADMGDLQGNSPSDFEISLRGISKAMDSLSGKSIPNLTAGLDIDDPSANINRKLKSGLLTPALLPELNQQIFTIGGNTVNNGMDMAIFEANVIRIIKREVSG